MYIRTSLVCSTLRVSSIRIFILIDPKIQHPPHLLHHHVSQSFDLPPATPPHLLHHHVSQSFDLPPATPRHLLHHRRHCITMLVSHLTCPLPPHHICCITTLVSHLTCPLPPHHIYHITVLPLYHVSQSFDLPPATPPHLPHHRITALPC